MGDAIAMPFRQKDEKPGLEGEWIELRFPKFQMIHHLWKVRHW
jgi:hypothetical protein